MNQDLSTETVDLPTSGGQKGVPTGPDELITKDPLLGSEWPENQVVYSAYQGSKYNNSKHLKTHVS